MSGQVDTSTLLWVVGIGVTITLALIGTIWVIVWGAITRLRNNIGKIFDEAKTDRERCDAKFEKVNERIDGERKERQQKHDVTTDRIFKEVDRVKEKTNDLNESVAGFGTIYVTRREHEDLRREVGELRRGQGS